MQRITAPRNLAVAGAAAIGASMIALTPAVSNDLAADLQRSAGTIEHRAVDLVSSDDVVVNPIQTWIDTFTTAAGNLEAALNTWSMEPFVVPQQLAANWLAMGSTYVGAYQQAALGAVNLLTAPTRSGFRSAPYLFSQALSNLQAGQVLAATQDIYSIYFSVLTNILDPLENALKVLPDFTGSLNAFTQYVTGPGLTGFGLFAFLEPVSAAFTGFGTSAQLAVDAYNSGNPLGAVIDLLNVPGATLNAYLNTSATGGLGIGITAPGGLVDQTLNSLLPTLASEIAGPNAQNIATGGSLPVALGSFVNQLLTGWPTPQLIFDQLLNTIATYGGFNFAAMAPAASTSILNSGGAMANLSAGLPGLSAEVVQALDPAKLAGIAASLGPSLGADITGTLGPLVGHLAVEIPTIALSILSAL